MSRILQVGGIIRQRGFIVKIVKHRKYLKNRVD